MKLLYRRFPLSSFLALVLAILLAGGTVFSGSLDPTFGTGGKFTISFPDASTGYRSSGYRVFYQPGDRIVAVGTFTRMTSDGQMPGVVMVGLTPAGALDGGFGGSGRIEIWDQGTFTGLSDAYMLPDGRVIRLSQVFPIFSLPRTEVTRSNTNGSPDGSFAASITVAGHNPIPRAVSVLSSGKIMVLASAQTTPETYHLFRLNADGSRDTAFGANGYKPFNVNRLPNLRVFSMKSLPNGKTVIAGSLGQQAFSANEFFIARFDSDGNLDASFGRFGIVRYAFGVGATGYVNDVMIDANGRCTVAGAINNPDQDVFMMRFSHRGKPDADFGVRGVVISDITPGGRDLLSSITVGSGGKLIVAGEASPTPGAPTNFLVARYSEGGVLEAHTRTEFTPGQYAYANHVSIQPDGKILVIGATNDPNTIPQISSMFAIARYTDITND